MNPVEILYTPLDTPELPTIAIPKLKDWINTHPYTNLDYDAKTVTDPNIYPWHVSYIRKDNIWLHNFDILFPSLAEYISSAFGLSIKDISTAGLLNTKTEFEGVGFWHSDVDSTGLRFYIENEEADDFLLIKPTKEPYNHTPNEKYKNPGIDPIQQDVIHSVKLLKPTQSFYLNNVRAIHAVKTNKKGCSRIVCLLGIDRNLSAQDMPEHLKKLIVNSADKYKEYAIIWNPPIKG